MLTLHELAVLKAARKLEVESITPSLRKTIFGKKASDIAYLATKNCPSMSKSVAAVTVSNLRSIGYLTRDTGRHDGLVVTMTGDEALIETDFAIRNING